MRIILTSVQAVEIYKQRQIKSHTETSLCSKIRGQSVAIAEKYGVSPKAIRDIWNKRTWVDSTKHLYAQESENGSTKSLVTEVSFSAFTSACHCVFV